MSNAPGGAAPPFYLALTIAVATSFAAGSATAPIAYAAGADALAVSTTRTAVAALTLAALLRAQGIKLSLPPRERWIALALGFINAGYSLALYSSLAYVPVAMAVLILYTYPLWTSLIAWISGAERPTLPGVVSLSLGLAGVGLVLGTPAELPDLRGVALAATAAFGFTLLLTVNARVFRGRDSRPITLHMVAAATLVYVVIAAGLQHFPLPGTAGGWTAFWLIPVFYSFSFIALFIVVGALGPVRTALVMNFEPVASVILGWLLLDQRLNAGQLLGAALVVAGITFAAIRKSRR